MTNILNILHLISKIVSYNHIWIYFTWFTYCKRYGIFAIFSRIRNPTIFTRLDYKRAVKYIFSQVKYNILPLFWKIFKYDYKLDSYRENIVSVLYLPIGYSKCTSDADIFPRAAPSEKYNASSVHLEHPQGRYNTSKIFARYNTIYNVWYNYRLGFLKKAILKVIFHCSLT